MKAKGSRQHAQIIDPKRKRLFSVIALSLPILFFLILELGLRLFHYGPDLAIFMQETLGGKTWYTLNPSCKNRYFIGTNFTPDPSPEHFAVAKPAGTFRIFCLGGSTTVGYPYWYNGAFASFLRERLKTVCPGRSIEVINLGMTATNSYTVLDIGRELIKYAPDLFIVYDGHNEFYGALGVASHTRITPARWVNLLYLRMVHLRTFQLVRNIIAEGRGVFGHSAADYASRATLMEQVAGGKNVPYESRMYEQAFDIFRQNMQDLAALCQKQKIPLILSTQSSNLRQQAPFISNHAADISNEQISRFQRTYKSAMEFQARGMADSALIHLKSAIALDSCFADAHYRMAQCLEAVGNRQQAYSEYLHARDYDELRFRTDGKFNNLIRSMASKQHCIIADIDRLFKSLSQDSLVGYNLISEHLHPVARGQFLMAGEYARIMQSHGLLASPDEWAKHAAMRDSMLWQNRPVTEVDEYMASRKIELLTSRWPFKTAVQAIAHIPESDTLRFIADQAVHNKMGWITAHESAADYYLRRGDHTRAAKENETIINQLPHEVVAYLNLAKIHYDDQDFFKSETVLFASLQVEHTPVAYRVLGDIALKQRDPDDAIRFYEILAKFPEDPATAPDNAYMLALAYLASGRPESAVPLLERTARRFPAYKPAQALLARVHPGASSHPVR